MGSRKQYDSQDGNNAGWQPCSLPWAVGSSTTGKTGSGAIERPHVRFLLAGLGQGEAEWSELTDMTVAVYFGGKMDTASDWCAASVWAPHSTPRAPPVASIAL